MALGSLQSNSPAKASPPGKSVLLDLQQIAPGCIIYLPRQFNNHDIICSQPKCNKHMDIAASGHPAIILEVTQDSQQTPMAICAMISSDSQPTKDVGFVDNLPIFNASEKVNHSTGATYQPESLLYLERQGTLHKLSYVGTKHAYSINVSKLRKLGNNHPMINRLDKQSYLRLMSKFDRKAVSFVPTPSEMLSTQTSLLHQMGHRQLNSAAHARIAMKEQKKTIQLLEKHLARGTDSPEKLAELAMLRGTYLQLDSSQQYPPHCSNYTQYSDHYHQSDFTPQWNAQFWNFYPPHEVQNQSCVTSYSSPYCWSTTQHPYQQYFMPIEQCYGS